MLEYRVPATVWMFQNTFPNRIVSNESGFVRSFLNYVPARCKWIPKFYVPLDSKLQNYTFLELPAPLRWFQVRNFMFPRSKVVFKARNHTFLRSKVDFKSEISCSRARKWFPRPEITRSCALKSISSPKFHVPALESGFEDQKSHVPAL